MATKAELQFIEFKLRHADHPNKFLFPVLAELLKVRQFHFKSVSTGKDTRIKAQYRLQCNGHTVKADLTIFLYIYDPKDDDVVISIVPNSLVNRRGQKYTPEGAILAQSDFMRMEDIAGNSSITDAVKELEANIVDFYTRAKLCEHRNAEDKFRHDEVIKKTKERWVQKRQLLVDHRLEEIMDIACTYENTQDAREKLFERLLTIANIQGH